MPTRHPFARLRRDIPPTATIIAPVDPCFFGMSLVAAMLADCSVGQPRVAIRHIAPCPMGAALVRMLA